jgi:hypothetical protein
MVIILGMMQVSKKINFDDPTILLSVRIAYVASNLLIAGIYLYIQYQINKKKDMTTLRYVEPAPMGSTDPPTPVTTTIHAYDSTQLRSLWKTQAMGVAMMAFMHLYMKYTNPLLIQSIIPLKGAVESTLAKIHVLGQPASGELKRPFKGAGGMFGMGGGEVKSDKKSFEEAEKLSRGGAKEE